MTGDGSLLVGGVQLVSVAEDAQGNSATMDITQTVDAAAESQFSWLAN